MSLGMGQGQDCCPWRQNRNISPKTSNPQVLSQLQRAPAVRLSSQEFLITLPVNSSFLSLKSSSKQEQKNASTHSLQRRYLHSSLFLHHLHTCTRTDAHTHAHSSTATNTIIRVVFLAYGKQLKFSSGTLQLHSSELQRHKL